MRAGTGFGVPGAWKAPCRERTHCWFQRDQCTGTHHHLSTGDHTDLRVTGDLKLRPPLLSDSVGIYH